LYQTLDIAAQGPIFTKAQERVLPNLRYCSTGLNIYKKHRRGLYQTCRIAEQGPIFPQTQVRVVPNLRYYYLLKQSEVVPTLRRTGLNIYTYTSRIVPKLKSLTKTSD
jgi:hypothetical protein